MRRLEIDDAAKGWFFGPWNSRLDLSIGYANEAIDEPHRHERVTEIYLVARGTSTVRVESETLRLKPGDALVIEPGEAHTFVESSEDYLHFVVHTPGLRGHDAQVDKQSVTTADLGV